MSIGPQPGNAESAIEIALVEYHDSVIESLSVSHDGDATLTFEHLNVFVFKSVDRYDVWSYRANLEFRGTEKLAIDGHLASSDWIGDGSIVDRSGSLVEITSPSIWMDAYRVEMILTSGSKLTAKILSVRLTLLEALEKLEEWDGPIRRAERKEDKREGS